MTTCWLRSSDKYDEALALLSPFSIGITFDEPKGALEYLCYQPEGLSLHQQHSPQPFRVDFLSRTLQHREAQLCKKNELFIRAIGSSLPITVLDLTAGFGRDGFLMASLGHAVTLVEQHPIVCALLQDALNRLKQSSSRYNLTLHFADSLSFLTTLKRSDYPNVIYLDPMFPETKKSARVKRPLQILQDWVGKAETPDLLARAREIALQRVIVKRPVSASHYQAETPRFSLKNQSIRFDVY